MKTTFTVLDKCLSETDYLLSSSFDRSFKLWNIESSYCILSIDDIYKYNYICSCLINKIDKIPYIITSVFENSEGELMKIFQLNLGCQHFF